jgi:tripartite-type tricarboxylate transporter receptor subunit TctC
MMTSGRRAAAFCAAAAWLVGADAPLSHADPVADFYRGKTVSLYVAFPPGGGYDIYSRLVARYMTRYVPGNPTIVTQNMPGAGGVKAANFLYSVAPKDGTAVGMIADNSVTEEIVGTPGITYVTKNFLWIGRFMQSVNVEAVTASAGFKSIDDVRQRELIVGTTGVSGITTVVHHVANTVAGTKFKIVTGYAGSPEACLAMERGEVTACTPSWTHVKTAHRDWLDQHKVNLILQWGITRHRELPDVPTMAELGRTPIDRKILALFASATDIGRSVTAPPGVPAERVKALRTAFDAAVKDPELLAEVKKNNLDYDPLSGEDLQKLVVEVTDVSPDVVQRARQAHDGK